MCVVCDKLNEPIPEEYYDQPLVVGEEIQRRDTITLKRDSELCDKHMCILPDNAFKMAGAYTVRLMRPLPPVPVEPHHIIPKSWLDL